MGNSMCGTQQDAYECCISLMLVCAANEDVHVRQTLVSGLFLKDLDVHKKKCHILVGELLTIPHPSGKCWVFFLLGY